MDSCDALTGCVYKLLKCDDGNACTIDTCSNVSGCSYVPVGPSFCNDNNLGTTDFCHPGIGCIYTPVPPPPPPPLSTVRVVFGTQTAKVSVTPDTTVVKLIAGFKKIFPNADTSRLGAWFGKTLDPNVKLQFLNLKNGDTVILGYRKALGKLGPHNCPDYAEVLEQYKRAEAKKTAS